MDLSKGPPAPPPTVPDFPELAPQIAMSGNAAPPAAPDMDAEFEKLYQAQSAANPQAVPQQAPAQAPIAPAAAEPNMDADFEKLYQAQTAAVQSSGPLQPMPAAQVVANPGGTPAAVPQGAPAVPAGQTAIVPGTAAVQTDPAAVAAAAAAPKVGKITMGRGAKMVKPPPPVVPQNAAMEGLNQGLKDIRQGVDHIPGIGPYLGEAIHTVSAGAKGVAKDFSHDPFGATGAAVAGAPAGLLGMGDDLMRIAGLLKKGEEGSKEAYLNSDFAQAMTKGHEGGEGLGELAGFMPAVGPEALLAGGAKAAIGKALTKPLAQAFENPNAAKIIGKMLAPHKVVSQAAHGALVGEGYGALGHAGQDIKSGKNAHLSDALKGGIPSAIIGAAAAPVAAKALSKIFREGKPKDNVPAPPPLTPKDAALAAATGSIDKPALIKELKDPATPPERKAVILDQLKDARQIALGLKKAPEVKAPEPVAAPAAGLSPVEAYFKTLDENKNPIKEPEWKKFEPDSMPSSTNRAPATSQPKPPEPPSIKADGLSTGRWKPNIDMNRETPVDTRDPREYFGKPAAEVPEAPAAKTPEQMRDEEEARLYPLHNKQFFESGTSWRPKELTDDQLLQSRDIVKSRMKEGGTKTVADKQQHDAYIQEIQRRRARMMQEAHDDHKAVLPALETPEEVDQWNKVHEDTVKRIQDWGEPPAKDAAQKTTPIKTPAIAETPEHLPPDNQSSSLPAENKTAPPATPSERYISRPDPDPAKAKAGYHQIWDTVLDEQKSSSKRKPADAEAVAKRLNEGTTKATQGQGGRYTTDNVVDPETAKMKAAGKPLGEDATPELHQQAADVAEAKHALDAAEAKYTAMHKAMTQIADLPKITKLKKGPNFKAEAEMIAVTEARREGRSTSFEVQNTAKHVGKYEFPKGTDADTAAQAVIAQHQAYRDAEGQYRAARDAMKSEFMKARDSNSIPRVVNIEHPKGTINIREIDPRFNSRDGAEVESHDANIKTAQNLLKNPAELASLKKRARGGRSQSGMINLGPRTKGAPPERVSAAALSMADGAEASSGIKALTNDLNAVKQIFNYRRTFDVARKVSHSLYDKLWDNVGKESMLGAGIKFSHDEEPLVHRAAGMSAEEIYTGQNGLDALTPEKLDYLATRNEARQDSAMHVKQALGIMKAEHGDHMPNAEKFDYEILSQLHDALIGKNASNGTSEFSQAGKLASAIMHDYIFKWNAGYHALNRLDPIMLGAARVQGNSWIPFHGTTRIIAAQHLLSTDKSVRDFVGGYAQDSPIQQLRAESNAVNNQLLPNGVKPDLYHAAKGKIASLQSKLPDIPSERFNYQDSFAAGVIQHGDETGYGGTQLLKDLASGKLSEDAKLKTIVEGLKAANDITGTGSHGLDKSPLQRSPLLKSIVAFVEQPYRIARLQADLARQAVKGDKGAMASLATLAATTIMVGGRAALPKEMDLMEMNPVARPVLRAVQDVLDKGNIVNNVFGRDLVDKLRWGLVPLLGGTGTNVALEQMQGVIGDFAGGKWSHLGTASLLLALSSAIGGGGVEMGKAGSAYNGVTKPSEKKVNVYDDGPMPQKGGFPIKKKPFAEVAGHPYGIGDAIGDLTLPGRSAAIGKLTKQARREKHDK